MAPPAAPTAAPRSAPTAPSFTTSAVLFCWLACWAAYWLHSSMAFGGGVTGPVAVTCGDDTGACGGDAGRDACAGAVAGRVALVSAALLSTAGRSTPVVLRSATPPVQFATTRPVTSALAMATPMTSVVSFQGFQRSCGVLILSGYPRLTRASAALAAKSTSAATSTAIRPAMVHRFMGSPIRRLLGLQRVCQALSSEAN